MTTSKILAAFILAAALAGGCVVRGRAGVYTEPGVVYVEEDPPPPRVVVVPSSRPGYIWIDGRWDYRGRQWVWLDGRYERERVGHVWAPGRWERRGRRRVWVEGRWNSGGRGNGSVKVKNRDHRDNGNNGGVIIRDHRR